MDSLWCFKVLSRILGAPPRRWRMPHLRLVRLSASLANLEILAAVLVDFSPLVGDSLVFFDDSWRLLPISRTLSWFSSFCSYLERFWNDFGWLVSGFFHDFSLLCFYWQLLQWDFWKLLPFSAIFQHLFIPGTILERFWLTNFEIFLDSFGILSWFFITLFLLTSSSIGFLEAVAIFQHLFMPGTILEQFFVG